MAEEVTDTTGDDGMDRYRFGLMSRKVITQMIADLEIKGGEGPALWFPKDAFIMPIYIVGADPTARTLVSQVVRTSSGISSISSGGSDTWVSKAVTVPDGAKRVVVFLQNIANKVGVTSVNIGWQGSLDGTTWDAAGNNGIDNAAVGDVAVNRTYSNASNSTESGFALPPFVRAVMVNSGVGTFDAKLGIVVD